MAKETKNIPSTPSKPHSQERGMQPDRLKNDNNLPSYTPPPPPPPSKDKK